MKFTLLSKLAPACLSAPYRRVADADDETAVGRLDGFSNGSRKTGTREPERLVASPWGTTCTGEAAARPAPQIGLWEASCRAKSFRVEKKKTAAPAATTPSVWAATRIGAGGPLVAGRRDVRGIPSVDPQPNARLPSRIRWEANLAALD